MDHSRALRLLLVEDRELEVRRFRRALIGIDVPVRVEVLGDGAQALDYLEIVGPPDLVVADLNLAQMSGIALIERIKETRAFRALPVILFTSCANSAEIERSFRAGAASYICKPSDPLLYLETVRKMLEYWARVTRLPKFAPGPRSETLATLSRAVNGAVLSWSAEAQDLYGFTAKEAKGKPIEALVPPEVQFQLRSILHRVRRREQVERVETVRLSKDGRRIPVSLTFVPLQDENGRVIGAAIHALPLREGALGLDGSNLGS